MTAVSLKVSESRASERARPGVVGIRVRSSDRRLFFLPWLAQRCGHDLNLVLPSRCAVLLLPVLPLRLCAAVLLRCSVRACVVGSLCARFAGSNRRQRCHHQCRGWSTQPGRGRR
jgi:hypothetical protein